ncbi:hypothetical protein OAG76_05045 [Rubripirellula sp.]|nr:hypothetical protein [Rubripirellula sp.]
MKMPIGIKDGGLGQSDSGQRHPRVVFLCRKVFAGMKLRQK